MKNLVVYTICTLFLFGCSHAPMNFQVPAGKTLDDFNQEKTACGDGPENHFFIAPLILFFPIWGGIELAHYYHRRGVQDCLEGKGFKCINNCAKESTTYVPYTPSGLQIVPEIQQKEELAQKEVKEDPKSTP